MLPYDLVVVEEVAQLSLDIFERIMQQWEAADRVLTLVFVGDFYQLPAADPSSALDSWMWHNVMVKKRHHVQVPEVAQNLRDPTLRTIMAGHKAPSLGRGGYIMNEEPSLDDVGHILAETPSTLFLKSLMMTFCAKELKKLKKINSQRLSKMFQKSKD